MGYQPNKNNKIKLTLVVTAGPNFELLNDKQIVVLTVADKFAKVQAYFTG